MLIVAAFMVTSVALLAPRSWRMFLVTLGLMLSPPVMLALERCNNDLIIFLLMVGAAWLVTRRFLGGMFAAAGLIVLAAALKLYPIVTLPTLAVRAVSRRWAIWLVFTTGVVCALVVLNSLEVYHRVSENAPEPITIFAYGGKISYYMLKAFPLERVTMLVGGIPLVFAAIWICWRCRRAYWDLVPATGFTAGCFLAGALAWIICYCGTTNFSYRLLLLLLPARLLLSRKMRGTGGVATRFLLVAILLIMWTPCSKHHLLQLNGVERFYGGAAFVWMTLGFEYALGLVISVMLGLALTGWAWRRFREEHV